MRRMTDPLERDRRLVEQFPDNELARFSLGRALFERGDQAGAIPHLERALARKPDWMVVHILLGKSRLALGDRAGAVACFSRARDLAIEQHHDGPLAELDDLLSGLK